MGDRGGEDGRQGRRRWEKGEEIRWDWEKHEQGFREVKARTDIGKALEFIIFKYLQ